MIHDLFVAEPWFTDPLPMSGEPAGMLGQHEARLFYHLAKTAFQGRGAIIDAGSFLGRSAFFFAQGLRANPIYEPTRDRVHCFDNFIVNDVVTIELLQSEFGDTRSIGQSTRDIFDRQVAPVCDLLLVHAGDFHDLRWTHQPVEILMVDIAISRSLHSRILEVLFPHLIPGVSLVVHHHYHNPWLPHIHVVMEHFAPYFERVATRVDDSAVFRLITPIPQPVLQRAIDYGFSFAEQVALMDGALSRLPEGDRHYVELARLKLLSEGTTHDNLESELARIERMYADSRPLWSIYLEQMRRHVRVWRERHTARFARSLEENSRVDKALALIEAAQAHLKDHEYDQAVEACRQAVTITPDWPFAYDYLGEALTRVHDYWHDPALCRRMLQDGRLDEAIACWRKALAMGWVSDWTELQLGHAFTAKGDYAAAATHLARAIDIKTAANRPEIRAPDGERGTRRGPDFLIIGAAKGGTTSLYEYMSQHPQVLPAIWKEIDYFRFPERGRDWYLSHFPRIPDGPVRFVSGEASTSYMSLAAAPNLVRAEFPDARLIALVRDPVARTISHCHNDRRVGLESRTVEDAITRELDILEALDRPWHDAEEYWTTERGYVWLSLYAYFLEDWLTVFPAEQLLVIPSEDLYSRPAETLSMVYSRLALPDHQLPRYEIHLKGEYEKKQTDPVRERLSRFFAPHNERLYELLGRRLEW